MIEKRQRGRPPHKAPPKGTRRHYLYEWMLVLRMTDQDLVDRWPKGSEPPRRETVNRWKHLAINMPTSTANRAAQALGIDTAQLFTLPAGKRRASLDEITRDLDDQDYATILKLAKNIAGRGGVS